ncbi:MAG: hypothetical protein AAGE93_00355 [Bacteroidota bacterium]
MKYALIVILLGLATHSYGQESSSKLPVYGSVSVGYGNTFFSGILSEKEERNDQRGFGRNDGITLATFYYWAPEKLRGLGIGTGVRAFVARPNNGSNQETYTYNYYHIGISIRDYFITKRFNDGLYVTANIGWGQGTEKYSFGNTNTREFQNALGITVLGGLGYSIPLNGNHNALNLDLSYEYSNRNAEITGNTDTVDFINSQISFNVGFTF